MNTHCILVDYENVPVKSLALLQGEEFRICVFLGRTNSKIDSDLAVAMQKMGDRAQYVKLTSTGPNALDFHIAFYLGKLVTLHDDYHFHIISKDKGFDALIARLQDQKLFASRSSSIEEMPCFAHLMVSKPAEAVKPAPKVSPTPNVIVAAKKSTAVELEERVQLVIANLRGQTKARPAKLKTLINSIHARIGKSLPASAAEAVCKSLVDRKYVVVNGLKVTYKLPKAG